VESRKHKLKEEGGRQTTALEPMSKPKKAIIEVQGMAIAVLNQNDQDYISLTDIARYRNAQEPFAIINNWMRGRSTLEFLGLWEKLSNPGFKPLEFERFRNEAGSNYFVLSPQRWIEATQADLLNVAHFGQTAFGICRKWSF
jgi:KilA-N domain